MILRTDTSRITLTMACGSLVEAFYNVIVVCKYGEVFNNVLQQISLNYKVRSMNAIQLKSSAFNGTQMRAQRCGVAQPRSTTASCVTVRAAQSLQGKVVSVGANNTTIVAVENISVHPLYSKRVKRTKRHTAHDDKGECQVGDIVMLKPCRPLSKTKRFTVDEIVFRGN